MKPKSLLSLAALVAVSAAFVLAQAPATAALAACDEPQVNCSEKFGNALSNFRHSGNLRSAIQRAREAGNALEDCVSCTLEELKRGLDSIRIDGNYTSSGSYSDDDND